MAVQGFDKGHFGFKDPYSVVYTNIPALLAVFHVRTWGSHAYTVRLPGFLALQGGTP